MDENEVMAQALNGNNEVLLEREQKFRGIETAVDHFPIPKETETVAFRRRKNSISQCGRLARSAGREAAESCGDQRR
ncbi:MAG: hypothetical protein KFB96_07830 [Thiocapsa sp.]|uniref:hypothetical protein n=1 Tax=Thiocapsa sp. TaxID=2024551 RepID=UPI001BCBA1F8|nr:hypothetical protein [Thiocapsa sp.]QVL50334.1 MAG: hypothetical protein KFB96_07830 [Thiocapsa sp.]